LLKQPFGYRSHPLGQLVAPPLVRAPPHPPLEAMVAAGKLSCAMALVASATANGVTSASPACLNMLSDVTSQGRSDAELAAFCRASLPPQFCREAASSLGQQPWSPDRIASTCKTWEDRWDARSAAAAPGREAKQGHGGHEHQDSGADSGTGFSSFDELQKYLDQCMAVKASAGICKKPGSEQPMDLNSCIDYKQRTYPEQTKRFTDAVNSFYSHVMSKSELRQEQAAAPSGPTVGLLGLGSVLAAATTAAAGFLRCRREGKRRALLATAVEEGRGNASEELIAE